LSILDAEKTMLENSAGDRMAKLPKWAQEYIADLKQVIGQRDAEIRAMTSVHAGSNVAMRDYAGRGKVTLPPNSHVVFYMEPDRPDSKRFIRDGIEVYHSDSAYGPELYISTNGGRLTVLPSASNSVRLRIDKR
jgi:hypothetical protein